MYNQLIYFVVALLLFSLQQPGKQASATPAGLLYAIAIFFLYVLYCRTVFQRIRRRVPVVSRSVLTVFYYRAQARLPILALVCLAIYVYVLDIKVFLRVLPGFDTFSMVSGLAGLGLYLLHLAVIWYLSHPVYREIHNSSISRAGFIKGSFSFNTIILVPWLLVTLISDLLQFLQPPAFLGTEMGQTASIGAVLLVFLLFAPWLVVRLWGCTSMPAGYVRFELRKFCEEHRFKAGDFLLWPLFGGEMLTAGVMGILPGFRYILITQGLLRILDIDELKAVVAHEMGHVRKLHMLIFFFFFALFITLTVNLSSLFELVLLKNRDLLRLAMFPGLSWTTVFSLAYLLPIVLLLVLYFRFIFGFFLRNSERQADLFSMDLIGTPLPLISSFQKIAIHSGRSEDVPSWHHYSIRERIQFLAEAYRDRTLIRSHNRKLYGSAVVFVLVIAVLIGASIGAGHTEAVLNLRKAVNAGFQAAVAGALFDEGKYGEAEDILKTAISMDPENATALNNLAWLYATAPPPRRNPQEALKLARQAASISQESFILDTLAEACFINGMDREALDLIDRALAAADGDNRAHYLKQKEKFEQALREKGA
jgi:Zn-dependent protease with chaperone function